MAPAPVKEDMVVTPETTKVSALIFAVVIPVTIPVKLEPSP
jgi:hypothetical protein